MALSVYSRDYLSPLSCLSWGYSDGGEGGGGCAGMGSEALGAGRNVNCCGIHAARVIVIHSYYTGNVCVERGV